MQTEVRMPVSQFYRWHLRRGASGKSGREEKPGFYNFPSTGTQKTEVSAPHHAAVSRTDHLCQNHPWHNAARMRAVGKAIARKEANVGQVQVRVTHLPADGSPPLWWGRRQNKRRRIAPFLARQDPNSDTFVTESLFGEATVVREKQRLIKSSSKICSEGLYITHPRPGRHVPLPVPHPPCPATWLCGYFSAGQLT